MGYTSSFVEFFYFIFSLVKALYSALYGRFVCMLKHYTMKMYGPVYAKLYAFLTSIFMLDIWLTHLDTGTYK
jgi:hypothetical protein